MPVEEVQNPVKVCKIARQPAQQVGDDLVGEDQPAAPGFAAQMQRLVGVAEGLELVDQAPG